MKKYLLPLAVSAFMVSGANAADEGWYIGLGAGQANFETQDDFVGIDIDVDDTTWKLFGGYRFNKHFAFEGQYKDFGEPDGGSGLGKFDIEADGFAGFAVGILPVMEKFDLFAKVGAYYWDVKIESDETGDNVTDGDQMDMAFGFGATYDITDNILIRGEFEAVDADRIDEVYSWTASVGWRF